MNILVTGAAGFIASHLIEDLLNDSENYIFGIDNFYSGTQDNIEFIKLKDKKNRFNFIKADIRDFEFIKTLMKDNNIEQVYHLAAVVSVQESIQNPLYTNSVNITGSLNILESSRLNNVKRVVFSSSAAVYGDEPTLPKDENSIVKPISPYGYEKLIVEQYMKLYSELYKLETVVLRYFNVYGQRQLATSDYSGVISIFDTMFKNNECPSIHGDGEQYRDFIYVKDIAKVNIKAMNTNGISGEIFCLGTSKKTSINDLFGIMNKKYKKSFRAKYKEARVGDILESVSNNKKVKKVLDIESFSEFSVEILKI
jgi:UDP-glucose 4-epimerase